jgi:hypothetical protein
MPSKTRQPSGAVSVEKDEESALPDEDAQLSAYDMLFYRYLQFVRNHAKYGAQLYREPINTSSFQNTNAFWSVREKKRFFRALERFGKRRVDLVCQFVNDAGEDEDSDDPEEEEEQEKMGRKKSVVDVVAYMEVLEAGVEALSKLDDEILPVIPESDSSSDDEEFIEGTGYLREYRASAREVSDEWIEHEERLAARLRAKERIWETEKRKDQRQNHARKFIRSALREDKELKKLQEEALISRTEVPTQESQDEVPKRGRGVRAEERVLRYQRREEMMEELQRVWDREDQMEHLGQIELRHLDSLMREDAEKGGPIAASGSTLHRRKESSDSAPSDKETQSPSAPVAIDSDDEEALKAKMATMTPIERRRLQKRLHMRRKRAEAKGEVANEDTARLKTGRKTSRPQHTVQAGPVTATKKQKVEESSGSTTEVEQSQDDNLDDDTVEGQKYKPRGLTFAQKAKLKMSELDIDMPFLQAHSLDLFNLSKFGNLWEYVSLWYFPYWDLV